MDKFQKSQWAKIIVLAILFLIFPLISTSLRAPYLFLLVNLLIIALGAESGVLAALGKPPEDKKPIVSVTSVAAEASPGKGGSSVNSSDGSEQSSTKTIEKPPVEKIDAAAVKVKRFKKCPSTPSLFFIGGAEAEELEDEGEVEEEEDGEEEEVGGPGGQELFTKAELFIGNFYKQLKIQREESWKRIHGFYHRAF